MPEPARVATAIRSLPLLGGVRTGHTLVVVSRNTRPTRVIAYDLDDRTIGFDTPVDDGDGAWGVTADDDWAYVGLLGARGRTNLYRVALTSGRAEGLAAIDAAVIWDLALTVDGRVVGVTDERVSFAWDPRTGRASALGLVDDGELARAVTVAGQRIVVGGTGSGRAWLRSYHDDGSDRRDELPAELSAHQTVYTLAARGSRVAIGTRGPGSRDPAVAVLDVADGSTEAGVADGEEVVDALAFGRESAVATVRRSGAVVRLDRGAGGLATLPAPVPDVENRAVSMMGDAIVGVAGDGSVWSMRADGTAVEPVHLLASGRVDGSPERVQSVAAVDGRVLVGGTFGFADHDLAADTATWRPVPGEAKAIVFAGDDAYLALYPIGAVYRLAAGADGAEPFAALPPEQNRPQDLAWVEGAGVLAVTTNSDRRGGGALHLVDRATGAVTSHVDVLARREHPTGLAAAGDRVLVGGSGAAPTLLCWDAAAGAEVWRIDGVDGAGALAGMAVVGDRLVAVGSRGLAVAVDVDDGTVAAQTHLDAGGGRAVVAAGAVVVTDGDRVWRLNPATLDHELLADGLDGSFWGRPDLAVEGDDVLVVAGRDLARLAVG